jgi:hypothetical protein
MISACAAKSTAVVAAFGITLLWLACFMSNANASPILQCIALRDGESSSIVDKYLSLQRHAGIITAYLNRQEVLHITSNGEAQPIFVYKEFSPDFGPTYVLAAVDAARTIEISATITKSGRLRLVPHNSPTVSPAQAKCLASNP